MVDANSPAATGARAMILDDLECDESGRSILCPSCESPDVGAGWALNGELRAVACHECGAVWQREPSKSVGAFAPPAEKQHAFSPSL